MTSGRPRASATLASIVATAPSSRMSGRTRTLGSFRCGRDSMAKKSSITPCGIVAVDQRRAERPERVGPAAHDRHAERHGRPFDRKRHQQPQPAAVFVAVADHRQPHLAVFQPRHGRRQEARVEEDVGLDGAVAQIVEFLDQVEAGRGRIDGQLPARPAVGQKFDLGAIGVAVDTPARPAISVPDGPPRHFLEKRNGDHQRWLPRRIAGGAKISMTMPSLRHTVKDSAMASKSMAPAVRDGRAPKPEDRDQRDAEHRH